MDYNPNYLDVATAYVNAGLRVLPASTKEKRPTLSKFKHWRKTAPNERQHHAWFSAAKAVCILTGEVSGNLEVLDFDQAGRAFEAWCELVQSQAAELMDRLVIQQSQSGGRHVIYRLPAPGPGSKVLARCPTPKNPAGEVLIETRGEGGLFMCDPSPGYKLLQGELTRLPLVTADEHAIMIEAARSLHEGPAPSTESPPAGSYRTSDGSLPGDDFNERGDIRPILERHGWRRLRAAENEQWCRPGKTDGCSATLRSGVFFVFSSNALPFEPNRGYAPFAVYALLEHGGDFSAAALSLRSQGYGSDEVSTDVDLSKFIMGDELAQEPESQSYSDPGPLPERVLRVPGFISEVMDHCLATAPYPNQALAFCGALALQAVLAGRKVRDAADNRTNLYLLALAFSSVGKDWPRKVNMHIMHRVGMISLLGEKFASGEGIQDALFISPSMLFQTDEIDGLLQSINRSRDARHEGIMGTMLTMYSAANSIYPMRRKAGKESPGAIDQPCLVVYGTAIPTHYYEALSERMLTNGFFARMLIVESGPRSVGQEPGIINPPDRVIETARWWADFNPGSGNLEQFHPQPAVVAATEDAKLLLTDARRQSEQEYKLSEDNEDSVGTTVWGRVPEQVRKLALLYAVSADPRSPVIDTDAVAWATTFTMHQTRRMLFMANNHVAENPFHADCLRVVRKLQKAPMRTITHSKLLKRMKMGAKAFHEMIATLEQQGDLVTLTQSTAGRPQRCYQLRDRSGETSGER